MMQEIGVTSVPGAIETIEKEHATLRTTLAEAMVRHAEQQARLKAMEAAETGIDLLKERTELAGSKARIESLQGQLHVIEERLGTLAAMAPQLVELERKREQDLENLQEVELDLATARRVGTLDELPNISIIQRPSPALKGTLTDEAILASLLGLAGLLSGAILAFLVRRPGH
jgi:uncharacterized protein involved in exopolysaccharide biosynthesis